MAQETVDQFFFEIVSGKLLSNLANAFQRGAPQTLRCGLVLSLAVQLLSFTPLSAATTRHQAQHKEPLGSLSSEGEVFVNDSPVPAESTIFAGDTLRTGETGTALFAISGRGALRISPLTQVVFLGDLQFSAELKTGSVIVDSISGRAGIALRAGNVVVVPTVRDRVTAAKVEREADGSFLVSCLNGDVGAIPMQGTSGQFLEAGQSVSISSQGQLFFQKKYAADKSSPGSHGRSTARNWTAWSLAGLGGAGAVGAVAALSSGGGKPSVSPSSP